MQLTSFIGRTHELTEITALLADPACRLLTLVGPGGIGKTRLALEVTRTMNFPDGVHFVALQPISDAALLPIAIANAIGIQFFGADEPRVQLVNYLQERQTLLILDNFEHLLDGVDFIVELLSAPGVKLLVASRTALNIQAEWRYEISGLETPSNGDTIENFDAVKLFAERARRLRHDFSPADHPADMIRICQLTEGMPLAIELAAGWIKALSCAEIGNEIQRGLDFLAADARDIPERHRSMAVAFSQSWAMLTESEQAVFRRMSVFRGGFTREAAEKITGANLQTLASLVDKSFLRIDVAGRYDIQELLRQYGEAKLAAAGEVEALCDAHCDYYLDFLAQREADVKGRRQIAALDEIERDFENMRAAWYLGADRKLEAQIGRAILSCSLFCKMRSRFAEHEALYTYAHKRFSPQAGEPPGVVYALLMTDRAAMLLSHYKAETVMRKGKALLDESCETLLSSDNPLLIGIALNNMASYRIFMSEPGALELLEKSLSIFQGLQDTFYIAEAFNWMAWCYVKTQQYQQAIQTIKTFYALALEAGDIYTAAWGAVFMNLVAEYLGDYDLCAKSLREGLQLMRNVGNQFGISINLLALAEIAFWRGDFGEARLLFDEAMHLGKKYGLKLPPSNGWKVGDAHFAIFMKEDYSTMLHISGEKPTLREYDRLFNAPLLCGLGNYEAAREILYLKLQEFRQTNYISGLYLCIIFALLVLNGQGRQYWAAQLMGFVSTLHPDVNGLTEKWGLYTRTRAHLQAELGQEHYKAAWEQGKNLDLFEAANDILKAWRDLDDSSPSLDTLTAREHELLPLIAAGFSNAQIATRLFVSIGTVKSHIHNIYSKLAVENRAQAIVRIRELDLL